MTERGVFAVDRGVFDHPIFAPEPFTEREAWLWMVAQAAWKATRVRVGQAVIELKRGQLAFSTRFLARKWRWNSDARVRRFLNRLKSDAMVDVRTTQEATQVTICNYDKWAFGRRTDGAPSDAPTDALATHQRRKEEELEEPKKEVSSSLRSDARAPKAKAATRKSRLPEDWQPSESDQAYGLNLGRSPAEIESDAEEMRLWAGANGATAVDWSLRFKGWMRRNAQRRGTGPPTLFPRPGSRDDTRERTANAMRKLSEFIDANADEPNRSGSPRETSSGVIPFAKFA